MPGPDRAVVTTLWKSSMSTGGARHRGNTLHRAFPDRRVNKVNPRREFFYATPEEVLDVLRQHVGEILSYTAEPEAEEYRISIGRKDASF